MNRALVTASLGLALLLAGCLDNTLPEDGPPTATVFIALDHDFAPFESWSTYDLGDAPLEGHPPGHRRLHVNQLPPPGATEFPVGTIIAKTVENGAVTDWLVHAMVKRGGGFNDRGARNWEWFELKLTEARVPVVVWRGPTPPKGEGYGCLSGSCEGAPDCNQCHAQAAGNDYVKSEALKLSGM